MYIKHKCTECEGKGSTVQRRKVTIPVPAGEISNLLIGYIFSVDKNLTIVW